MKRLFEILKSNRNILFFVLLSFIVTAFFGNFRIFTISGFLLFFWAIYVGLPVLNNLTRRVFLILVMFFIYWITSDMGFAGIQHIIHHVVPICVLYIIGRSLVQKNLDGPYLIGLVLIIALCNGLYDIGFTMADISKNGLFNTDLFLNPEEIETEEGSVATSLRAAELAPLISCVVFFFISSVYDSIKSIKWLGGILSVIAVLCTLHYVSRSSLVVLGACVVFGVFYRGSNGRKSNLGALLLLFAIAYVLFNYSDVGVLFKLKSENAALKGGNGRVDRILLWFDIIKEHPFGTPGWQNMPLPYAHNFWIDFAKIAGWIPALCLILFSYLNIRDVVYIHKSNNIPGYLKLTVLSMLIAFLLAYGVEPIFEGTKNGLYCYFFYCGVISAIAEIKKPITTQ